MAWLHTNDRVDGPDVYFSSAYGRAVETAEEGTWLSLELIDGAALCPLLIRDLPSGRRDAISPYGYAGVWHDPNSKVPPEKIWLELLAELRKLNVVSVFIRESPLVPQIERPEYAEVIVDGHPTYMVPVEESESMWSQMQGRSRTAVRKAWKLGATARFAKASAADLAPGSDFRVLYDSTMQRVGSSEYYRFGDEYYAALSKGLGADLYLGTVELDGNVESAALFMRSGPLLHYHLSGSTQKGSKSGCVNLLLWSALASGAEAGIKRLHLGGGLRNGDGLERFKKSFGGTRLSFGAYGVVVDKEGYREEVKARARELSVPVASLVGSDFFPAYRRPLEVTQIADS